MYSLALLFLCNLIQGRYRTGVVENNPAGRSVISYDECSGIKIKEEPNNNGYIL